MIFFWLIAAALIVFGIFSALVFPVWSLVDCFSSSTLTTLSKVIWGCFLLIMWTPAAIVYGLIQTASRALKRASVAVLVIGLADAGLFLFSNQMLSRLSIQMNDLAADQVRRAHLSGIGEQERERTLSDLETLSNETRGLQIWQRAKRGRLRKISEVLRTYTADGELTQYCSAD